MQIPGESIGIIADDLTGACDTGLQFHREGGNARILLDYTAAVQTASIQVWLVNTDSRHMEPYDAVAAVRKSVRFLRENVELDRFYKKIDSTLRGHIAQECLAILDELRWKAAIIAPAYPDENRRTIGGYQIVNGLPVGQTETALDPLFPVSESHIPTLLGKSSDPSIVGHIPLGKVMDGAGPILMALQEQITQQNKKLIVVDACSDTDLEQLSLAINKMPSDINVLPCGSAGLAKALSKKWLIHPEHPANPNPVIENTPLLLVVGTASRITRSQISALLENFNSFMPNGRLEIFNFSPAQVLGMMPLEQEIQQIVQALSRQSTVVVSTSFVEDSLAKTLALAEEHNIPASRTWAMASELLARVTRDVISGVPVKLLLSGGDTANVICKAIGTRSLQIVGQMEQSIPLMIDEQARWIITKSGGFGNEMSLLSLFKRLKDMESPQDAEVQRVK